MIDFIMNYEKITKHEAIMKAKEMLGVIVNVEIKSSGSSIKEGVELSRQAVLLKYYQSTIHSFALH